MKTSLYASFAALTLAACSPEHPQPSRHLPYNGMAPTNQASGKHVMTRLDSIAADTLPKIWFDGDLQTSPENFTHATLFRFGSSPRGAGGVDSLVLHSPGSESTEIFYTNSAGESIVLDSTAGSDVLDRYTRIRGPDTLRIVKGYISINGRTLNPADPVDRAVLRQPPLATLSRTATGTYNRSMQAIIQAIAQRVTDN